LVTVRPAAADGFSSGACGGLSDSPVAGAAGLPGGLMETLDRDTCFELLRTVAIGRVAWAAEDGHAVVLPVNFVVNGDSVVFRTAEGSKLHAVREGHRLSFEADDVEPALHVGWSVLITGVAEILSEAEQVRRLEDHDNAPGSRAPNRSSSACKCAR
jgi:nitroimidazol reductase NimA-like FMN-containing flavoprotein (pyridoxamine 5'-phosphate oxidase superfamily)